MGDRQMTARAMLSSTGLWRLPAAFYALKEGYPISHNRWGAFRCADFASAIQFLGSWEREVKQEIAKCDGLFVDVGANIGFYSIMAAKKGNKVIALEPNKVAYACLRENAKLNGVRDLVTAFNWAAWSESGFLKLQNGRHTDISHVGEEGEDVLGMPLDTILNGEIPDLLKIDAEGSEPQILRGMQETLMFKPKVVFEALSKQKLLECVAMLPHTYHVRALDRSNYLAS